MKKAVLAVLAALTFTSPAWAAVDINTASQAELESINGIGPVKAQAIIEYRKKNGPFKSAADLDNVPGFGEKSMEKVKQDITVGNTRAAGSGKTSATKSVKEATAKEAKPVDIKKTADSKVKAAKDAKVKEVKEETAEPKKTKKTKKEAKVEANTKTKVDTKVDASAKADVSAKK